VKSQIQLTPQEVVAANVSEPTDNKVSGYVDNVLRVKNLPTNPFRWLPFLFTFMYLAGRGNTQEAARTFAILIAGSALASLFALFGLRGVIPLITIASYVFNFYYSYLLATRADSLVRRDSPFNWGLAIIYGFAFAILALVFSSISEGPRYWSSLGR